MKTKPIDTINSNEDYVRLKIYEGDLQLSEAGEELLRIEREQRKAERVFFDSRLKFLQDYILKKYETPE